MKYNMSEEWKAIEGYEDAYQVSSFGRIRSLSRDRHIQVRSGSRQYSRKQHYAGRELRQHHTKGEKSYLAVNLWKGGKSKTFLIHRLVAKAFLGKKPERNVIRHLDDNIFNNHVDNLKYGTHKENMQDASRNETIARGEMHGRAKLTNAQVREIKRKLVNGEKQAQISKEYNVSKQLVSAISTGRRWKHL